MYIDIYIYIYNTYTSFERSVFYLKKIIIFRLTLKAEYKFKRI